ncbi:2-aminoglycoside phosphotransferase [Paenibacillus yonginensis]|uniref:2-aminoglycoside phosphotransferase n=1 Tax=Paenibacillus yonginensis TaxID=1462996 RepID=A0A1B1MZY3_9BACL|nr:GNAT family N-acetyltransferase [Paenibacillus yonginensis]ANS74729.1 2-aminoglycoside phosphotransferase [Paenibacillus yonginensis]
MIARSKNLVFRSLEEQDALLLSRWLSDPAVLEYYEGRDRPHDVELVKEHFYKDREGITACIIRHYGRDIGYMQVYEIEEAERKLYGYADFQEVIYGMDQFIGEPDCWNRGLGTELVDAMVAYLAEERKASRIVMDPQAWNARAIRVYEKCGFVKKQLLPKHEWHEGEYRDCWLMEYEANKAV